MIRHTDPLDYHEVLDLREGVSVLSLFLYGCAFTITLAVLIARNLKIIEP